MKGEFVLDAGSDDEFDLTSEEASKNLNPTKDVAHSILEPMKIEPLRLPPHIIERMKASYEEVCLNDFQDDMYHMSEEDRKQTFQFYEVFRELRMIKIKHRTLNSYVDAYRIMMKVLNAVAEVNGVYTKEEFVKKVLKGKIKVSGLKKPKYIGRGKKDINWDMVAEYIIDTDKDPNELMKNKNNAYFDIITEEDIEALEEELSSDIMTYIENSDTTTFKEIDEFDLDEDDLEGHNVAVPLTKKDQRSIIKGNKSLLIGLKDSKKLRNSDRLLGRSFAFELTQDAFNEIRERDESTGRIKAPEFKGDATNKEDVKDYLAALDAFEREHTKVEYNGRYYSIDEVEEMELKSLLEHNGFDIRKFYSYKEDEKKMKRQKKKDEKKIKRLKKTLRAAKKRYEERDSNGKIATKKKKKSKKNKKKDKEREQRLTPSGYDSFDDYAKMMESWND